MALAIAPLGQMPSLNLDPGRAPQRDRLRNIIAAKLASDFLGEVVGNVTNNVTGGNYADEIAEVEGREDDRGWFQKTFGQGPDRTDYEQVIDRKQGQANADRSFALQEADALGNQAQRDRMYQVERDQLATAREGQLNQMDQGLRNDQMALADLQSDRQQQEFNRMMAERGFGLDVRKTDADIASDEARIGLSREGLALDTEKAQTDEELRRAGLALDERVLGSREGLQVAETAKTQEEAEALSRQNRLMQRGENEAEFGSLATGNDKQDAILRQAWHEFIGETGDSTPTAPEFSTWRRGKQQQRLKNEQVSIDQATGGTGAPPPPLPADSPLAGPQTDPAFMDMLSQYVPAQTDEQYFQSVMDQQAAAQEQERQRLLRERFQSMMGTRTY